MKKALVAVIFDMDGVITNSMPCHYYAWNKIFHDEGIPVSRLEIYVREGQKGIQSVLEIFAHYRRPITAAKAREVLKRKEVFFQQIVRKRFVTGSRAFIRAVKAKGVKIGLVTGTSRREVYKILPKSLIKSFDVIITGSDVVQGKPHPEPYLKAMRALNVAKGKAIVIENAPFGIISAKRAGLKCLALKTSLPARYLQKADKILKDFKELKSFIKKFYA